MRETIIDQDIPLADDVRLIKKIWKVDKSRNFPEGLEFAFQLLHEKSQKAPYFNIGDEWLSGFFVSQKLCISECRLSPPFMVRVDTRP